jgi:hypothetical protein
VPLLSQVARYRPLPVAPASALPPRRHRSRFSGALCNDLCRPVQSNRPAADRGKMEHLSHVPPPFHSVVIDPAIIRLAGTPTGVDSRPMRMRAIDRPNEKPAVQIVIRRYIPAPMEHQNPKEANGCNGSGGGWVGGGHPWTGSNRQTAGGRGGRCHDDRMRDKSNSRTSSGLSGSSRTGIDAIRPAAAQGKPVLADIRPSARPRCIRPYCK